jgi:hypothetical protein
MRFSFHKGQSIFDCYGHAQISYFEFILVADSEPANRRNSKRRGDDVGEGAQLLLGFSNAKRPKGPGVPDTANPCKKDLELEESAGLRQNEQESVRSLPIVMSGPQIDETWAWERSCHEGLLTFHDGKKRWYHCMYCQVLFLLCIS